MGISRLIKPQPKKIIQGSSIIESIVAIGLISLFIAIFGTSHTIITTSQHLKYKNLANNLASEQIEALKAAPFSKLANQANGDFIEVVYNKGAWLVSGLPDAPSPSNALELESPGAPLSGITGLAAVPGFEYADFTFESSIKIDPVSPANWRVGILARNHDINNHYLLYFDSDGLYIKKNVDGAEETLSSKTETFEKNEWYDLKIIASGNSFEIFIDDVSKLTATDDDNSFSHGRISLLGVNSVHAYFDDISITATSAKSWNFDSDTTGDMPGTWQRFSIDNLPNGAGKLTIENAEAGYTDIKKVIAKVEWLERNNTHFVEIITLITE